MCKIEIKQDLYNICKRLKQIDSSYFVMYNKSTSKYEIHSSEQYGNTYALTIPYNKLDKRAIDYCLSTRRENYLKLIKEMEINNQKLENKEIDNIIDRARYDLTSKLKYYQNK